MGVRVNETYQSTSPVPGCSVGLSLAEDGISPALAKSPLRLKLESWLNKNMKIQMTDGRVLVGIFLCTDRDKNVILGSCAEYLRMDEGETNEEPRVLGLAMVPGHHIVSIHVDIDNPQKHVLL